jgi:hypothetical protein
MAEYNKESSSLQLRRIIAIEVNKEKSKDSYSCNIMTLSGIEAIYYKAIDDFPGFESVLPSPQVRESIKLVFEDYSIRLYVPSSEE